MSLEHIAAREYYSRKSKIAILQEKQKTDFFLYFSRYLSQLLTHAFFSNGNPIYKKEYPT